MNVNKHKLHFISFHFISFHFISFHFISFHFISFHFISFHFISFLFISFHFILTPCPVFDQVGKKIMSPFHFSEHVVLIRNVGARAHEKTLHYSTKGFS